MSEQAAIYARVSSSQQAQAHTIDSQIEALKTYATEQNVKVDEDLIFTDDGISGATLIRPALDRLRDKAFQGIVTKVFVLSPDRLARKNAHQLLLTEEFNRLGVEVIFSNREISSSPEDQLLLQIQGVISEYEREKIMERSRRGKLHKAKAGQVSVLSGAPYGYVYIKKQESAKARYEIHFEEARWVRQIYQKYTDEPLSIGAIAKWLNSEEVPTRKQIGLWERSTVWGILKNPAYKGEAAFKKTKAIERTKITKLARDGSGYPKHPKSSTIDCPKEEWISIKVPTIISEDDFKKASIRLEENKRLSPRNNKKYDYLLSGLMHCKECGYALYGKVASQSKYKRRYYRCMGQDGYRWPAGRVCASHPVRVEVLDDLVWAQTKRLIEDPEAVLLEYSERCHQKENHRSTVEGLIRKKQQTIQRQMLEKERVLDLYQAGVLSLEDIEERLTRLRANIDETESEMNLLKSDLEQKQRQLQLIEQFDVFKETLVTNLSNLTFVDKKKIVRLLVREVVVDSQNDDILIKHILPMAKKSCPLRPGSQGTAMGLYSSSQFLGAFVGGAAGCWEVMKPTAYLPVVR